VSERPDADKATVAGTQATTSTPGTTAKTTTATTGSAGGDAQTTDRPMMGAGSEIRFPDGYRMFHDKAAHGVYMEAPNGTVAQWFGTYVKGTNRPTGDGEWKDVAFGPGAGQSMPSSWAHGHYPDPPWVAGLGEESNASYQPTKVEPPDMSKY